MPTIARYGKIGKEILQLGKKDIHPGVYSVFLETNQEYGYQLILKDNLSSKFQLDRLYQPNTVNW